MRGRHARQASPAQRREVLALLSREGPGTPISKLVERVPEVGRRELEELRARAAYVLRRRHQECFYELSWSRPGASRRQLL